MTERDLFAVDPIAASELFQSGFNAGVRHVRILEVPTAWNRGFLSCLCVVAAIWLYRVLT